MRALLALFPFFALAEPPPRRRSDPEPEREPEPLPREPVVLDIRDDDLRVRTIVRVEETRRERPVFVGVAEPPPRRYASPELAVPCPRGDCRAAPGEPCNPRTLVRHRFHKDRVVASRQAK